MRHPRLIFIICLLLNGCFGVPSEIKHQYTLTAFRTPLYAKHPRLSSLYVSVPEAVERLETEKMIYTTTRFETQEFAHNAWSGSPANMLYPLMIQSLEATHAFQVLSAGTHAERFRYRLSTEVLQLEQSFLTKPSQLHFAANVIISDTLSGKPVASKLFKYQIPCPFDTPYGGAIAANQASARFTYELSTFTIRTLGRT